MDLVWDNFCTSRPHIQGVTPSLFRSAAAAAAPDYAIPLLPLLPLFVAHRNYHSPLVCTAHLPFRSPFFLPITAFADLPLFRFLPLTAYRLTGLMFLSLTSVTAYRFCRVTFCAFTAYRSYLLSLASFSAYLVYRLPPLPLTSFIAYRFCRASVYRFYRVQLSPLSFRSYHFYRLPCSPAYRSPLTAYLFSVYRLGACCGRGTSSTCWQKTFSD